MNGEIRKASTWKRGSAYIFDFVMLATIAVGIALLFSTVFGYDSYTQRGREIRDKYAEEYGVDLELTAEELETLPQEQKDIRLEAEKAFQKDPEAIYVYNMISSLMLVIISLSILVSYVLLEFVVPLLFGNGQTLGKKIFGVAIMRTNSVKISNVVLFVRTILGKYAIETMVPVLMIMMLLGGSIGLAGIIVLFGMLILQLCLLIFTKNRTTIHDLLADCVAVDMASQMIFESEEAIIEYKKRIHAEMVQKENY